ncbi:MAG: peptidase S10 [Verrucomicrobia bacterium]|nr:peptidase S10 [Verrucomicrobiota bacterium]
MDCVRSFILCIAILSSTAAFGDVEPKATPCTNTTTSHTLLVQGKKLDYEAVTGTFDIKDQEQKPQGSLFYTAYFKQDAKKSAKTSERTRPIAFCFNGGPGSSSVWLHMGFSGPKKVCLNDCAQTPIPGVYENNPYTLLDKTDLVFIDPVSTGFSTALPGTNPRSFYGIQEDIDSFSEFIRLFLTKYHRWDSPRFLIGESYGTIRAVGLAEKLESSLFINLNGIILLSPCLDFQFYFQGDGNDLPYALYLPSYTAAAWYHKRLPEEQQKRALKELLAEVEQFALQEYVPAMLLGNRLDNTKREVLISKLSQYTGLSPQYIQSNFLRISAQEFFKELLKSESKVIGRFDSRYSGFYSPILDKSNPRDPSFDAVIDPFNSAFQQYLFNELTIDCLQPYTILNAEAVLPWNLSFNKLQAGLGYLRTSPIAGRLLERNPSLGIFVASGYYDLATPYFAAQQTFASLDAAPSLLKNITLNCYEAGHMMYLHEPSHARMAGEIRKFIEERS